MDGVAEQVCVTGGRKGKGRGRGKGKGQAKQARERNANWSDQETNLLLDLLEEVQCRRQDTKGNGGFNDQEWSYVYTEFTTNNTQKRALSSLKTRWKNLKCDFGFYYYMANHSGCSWNEDAHMPDVPDDAWEHLQKKDSNQCKKYFNKPFPWYKRVEALYGKGIATGRSNITTDPNRSIPCGFVEDLSSSGDNDDDETAAQQEINDFSIPEFRMMVDDELGHNPVHVSASVDPLNPITSEPIADPFYVDTPIATPLSSTHVDASNTYTEVPAPSSHNRKRSSTSAKEPSRRTKQKQNINRMDEFAERFLIQQQQRTELIAQLGQPNRVHDQALNELHSLALPADVHVNMEMSLGNSWIRGCFIKEEDNERLMMMIDRAVGMFRSGKLPINP